MAELVPFVILVVAVAAIGLWLGILLAPRIGRLAERDDESPEERADQRHGDEPDGDHPDGDHPAGPRG
jgi:hypothetical protein